MTSSKPFHCAWEASVVGLPFSYIIPRENCVNTRTKGMQDEWRKKFLCFFSTAFFCSFYLIISPDFCVDFFLRILLVWPDWTGIDIFQVSFTFLVLFFWTFLHNSFTNFWLWDNFSPYWYTKRSFYIK